MKDAFGGPEPKQGQRYRQQLFLRGLHRPEFGERFANLFAPAGNLFDLGGHHPGHHEIERDRHQDAQRWGGNEQVQPGDGFLQAFLDEADRNHVLRGGGLDADIPDGGGLYRRDHQHAGEGAPLVDAKGGDDTERDRHQAGDTRGGGGNQKRHHEADQNGPNHDVTHLDADTRENSKRDTLVEPGRRHGGG